ncbi:uncharacterized protein LOC126902141 [Daktulosphaira vitifoliae]|uniref:uncharacterized protein LOC126902141 n=1 Tax=Daktulosphaira vitifoliae TaxID=58002 RepID=UPI0021AAD4B6|nr:uncharacterized protein LOC126902141 [Daktulosphaira vitifoliae]
MFRKNKFTAYAIIICIAFQLFNLESVDGNKNAKNCQWCKKPAKISTRPCRHNLCVDCAAFINKDRNNMCPFSGCEKYTILSYERFDEHGLCTKCEKEASSVTIIPCFHRVGNLCSNNHDLGEQNKLCIICDTPFRKYLNKYEIENKCINCQKEYPMIIMRPCNHRIGPECYKQYMKSEKCPKCNIEVKLISYNEKECSICGETDRKFVTLIPCLHKICNLCANNLMLNEILFCPFCKFELLQYVLLMANFIKRCICRKELQEVTVHPCKHKVGVNCAEKSWEKAFVAPKCPECDEYIKYFDIDDENLRKKLNPERFNHFMSRLKTYIRFSHSTTGNLPAQ